jgi:hypothetical protein
VLDSAVDELELGVYAGFDELEDELELLVWYVLVL